MDTLTNSLLQQIHPDSIKATIQWLQNFTTRFALDPNHRSIASGLQQKFISMGYQNTVLDSFLCITHFNPPGFYTEDTTWQYNVVATLEGSIYPDSVCIAGGHYDSFSDSVYYGKAAPGADDDASGVASCIEIARVFKKMNFQPHLTIKFIAFAAEEIMFYIRSGAEYYAAKADSLGEKIKFFASNDMIGYEPSDSNWHADLYCFDSTSWMNNFAANMSQQYTSVTPNIINQIVPGDAFRFYEKGFQTIHFFEVVFNPFYHTNKDVVDNLNMPYCAEMTKITMAMLLNGSQTVVGIRENPEELNAVVKVYPNPADEKVYIQYSGSGKLNMKILNDVGATAIQEVLKVGINIIDIHSLKKGFYLIYITGTDGIYHQKLIKN